MKKSIYIAAIAALFFIACKNSNSENNAAVEAAETAPSLNDSAVKAHGHSHDTPAPAANDSAAKAHGHSHETPESGNKTSKEHGHSHETPEVTSQDSAVKAHGHAH